MDIIKAFNEIMNESKTQEKNIRSYLVVLIKHMLKCKYQNDYKDKKSWRDSIYSSYHNLVLEFLDIGKGSLYKTFFMKKLNFDTIYDLAVKGAARETGLPLSTFPNRCEWTREQLVDIDFIDNFVEKYGKNSK